MSILKTYLETQVNSVWDRHSKNISAALNMTEADVIDQAAELGYLIIPCKN